MTIPVFDHADLVFFLRRFGTHVDLEHLFLLRFSKRNVARKMFSRVFVGKIPYRKVLLSF